MMMGMVLVTSLAARTAPPVTATMTSTSRREPIGLAVRPASLEHEVSALDVADFPQRRHEGIEEKVSHGERGHPRRESADSEASCSRLGTTGACGKRQDRSAHQECASSHHWFCRPRVA
jgi:hypothetical protein